MNKHTPEQRIKSFEKRQYIVSFLVLIIFCGLSIVLNSIHLQSMAEEDTKFLSRMIELGDFREASLVLEEAHLSNFKMIRYRSSVPGSSFILPPKAELFDEQGFWKSLTIESITIPVANNLSSFTADEITYEFNRFSLMHYAFFLWVILNLVSIPQTRFMKRRLIEQFNIDLSFTKELVKSQIAKDVRHNLRNPLAALIYIPKRLPDSVAKDRELLELTIGQIRALIAQLGYQPNDTLSKQFETSIYQTLLQAQSELELYVLKSIDFRFELDDMISSALVNHVPFELRSILGNLVTNSIEAIDTSGQIFIKAFENGAEILISVSDTGRGIKSEDLERIFERDISIGKKGTGIGLSHAKENIESWGGRIWAESVIGLGSTLNISLPIKDREAWYVPRLKFNSNSKICVLDDQESARELWRLKLGDAKLHQQMSFASCASDVEAFRDQVLDSPERFTFLFDYDLGPGVNGLSLLKTLPSQSSRYLITGHFDNEDVRRECLQSGVMLIPKSQISELPIVVR